MTNQGIEVINYIKSIKSSMFSMAEIEENTSIDSTTILKVLVQLRDDGIIKSFPNKTSGEFDSAMILDRSKLATY